MFNTCKWHMTIYWHVMCHVINSIINLDANAIDRLIF